MIIRKSTWGDLDRMMAIYAHARRFMAEHGNPNQWGPTHWPPEALIHSDIRSGNSYVCVDDGDRVVGFVGYGHHGPEDPDTGEVYALYVLPEYQGMGVGRQLLDAALDKLSAFPHLCLWAVKGNERAIRFYEKNGFRLNGEEKFVSSISAGGVKMIKER